MSDSYVCSGAMMKCTMGTAPAKLTVLPTRTADLTGKPQANISDHKTMVNLAPFGLCRSLAFPQTAAATAAALGTLTPTPCMHNTPDPWMGGKNDYLTKGQPTLLKSSICQCKWGGIISIINDGQEGENSSVDKQPRTVYDTRQPDRIILYDAYWKIKLEKDGKAQTMENKIRFLPQLRESVPLIVEFYYFFDNDIIYDKDKAELKIQIPHTCIDGITYTISLKEREKTSKVINGHVVYKATIDPFTFDLMAPS